MEDVSGRVETVPRVSAPRGREQPDLVVVVEGANGQSRPFGQIAHLPGSLLCGLLPQYNCSFLSVANVYCMKGTISRYVRFKSRLQLTWGFGP